VQTLLIQPFACASRSTQWIIRMSTSISFRHMRQHRLQMTSSGTFTTGHVDRSLRKRIKCGLVARLLLCPITGSVELWSSTDAKANAVRGLTLILRASVKCKNSFSSHVGSTASDNPAIRTFNLVLTYKILNKCFWLRKVCWIELCLGRDSHIMVVRPDS
jgi:hypothetical protein